MEISIETIEDFFLMGPHIRTRADGDNERDIPAFWTQFSDPETASLIQPCLSSDVLYGLCTEFDSSIPEFTYAIGYPVSPGTDAPRDMRVLAVQGGSFLVGRVGRVIQSMVARIKSMAAPSFQQHGTLSTN